MKAGDRVVCIQTVVSKKGMQGPIKGRIYTILGIYKCTCGNFAIDVGFYVQSMGLLTDCLNCNARHLFIDHWYMPKSHFRLLDWDDCREELIDQVFHHKEEILTTQILSLNEILPYHSLG